MSSSGWRAAAAGVSVALGAGVGVVTNVVTESWDVGLLVGLIALVVAAVVLQVLVSLLADREGGPAGGTIQLRAAAKGQSKIMQAGRDIVVPPGHTRPDVADDQR
ncbi:hypothetical protein Ais01nite_00220 [Asanoa ishikariensis]|uniref:Uncharacterized protein n=1 Tax=Asanoa ishikariensis TaxID=137265 RepID=A0A1H3TSX6_9ACTN|nr:hypothetical protein [Asanoa ishikariensis]GIF61987.1 hypothetical protein Ais01nite_00220 [Asanoa ishikariensis]SDZ52429.1 hypothetical protein SAMN05421684_6201 [Asanoa ishikariensis]